jgi:hypothetical protein
MLFNPFFLQCSLNEPNEALGRQLKNLAFGKGGLVFRRADGKTFISAGSGEFLVPDDYDEKAKKQFFDLTRNSDYDDLANKVFQQRTGMKKSDRLRMVTDAVLSSDSIRARETHAYVLLAILLKLVDSINEFQLDHYNLNFIVSKSRL